MKKSTCVLLSFVTVFTFANTLTAQWVYVGLGNSFVRALVTSPNGSSGNTLFAGTYSNGVFISSNNGEDWAPANNGLTTNEISPLLVSGSNVFAGSPGGIYLTSNNGISWIQTGFFSPTEYVFCLAADSSSSGEANIFAGTNGNIYRSTDNGMSWFPINNPASGYVTAIATAPTTGGTNLFVGDGSYNKGNGHVYLSTDSGMNWTLTTQGILMESVTVLAVSPTGGGEINLFAGTDGAGIFLSTNNGSNWNAVNTGLNNLYVSDIVVTGTTLIAGAGYVFLSTNNGTNWSAVNEGLTNQLVFPLMVSDTYIFAGTYNGGVWRRPLSEIVPVELTSFTASAMDNNVELSWITATETNNQGFEVQRNKDGEFETIGFVAGHGTTTESQVYSFTDNNVVTGKYNYRLKQLDFDGSFEYSNVVEVEVTSPSDFSLEQNYPNPFNPSTVISYQLPVNGNVTLKVYDVLGNEVATLVDEYKPAGKYEVEFSAKGGSASGGDANSLSSGIYFYQLKAGSYIETKKMILMK